METNPARFGCRSGLSRPDTYDQEPPRALWIHGPTLRRLDKRQHFAAGLRPRKRPWMRVWSVEESSKYRWHIVYPTATLGPMKDVGLRIRIDRDLREKFLRACKAEDRPAAQVIREFMRA